MKHRMSISVEEETVQAIQDLLRNKRFRNKSHAIETAIHEFLKEVK